MQDALDASRRFAELVLKRSYGAGNFSEADFWACFIELEGWARAGRAVPPMALEALHDLAAHLSIRPGAPIASIRKLLDATFGAGPVGDETVEAVVVWLRSQVNGTFVDAAEKRLRNRRKLLGFE